MSDEEIAYCKNLLSMGKYEKYNPLMHCDPSLVDPRDLSYEDPLLICNQCEEKIQPYALDVMKHFKEICPAEDGIECN